MHEDNMEAHIGDMVEFYNIHPIGGRLYGIIADAKAGELLDLVHPDYPYSIWRPLDIYVPIRSENRILKVIHNIADAKNDLLPFDEWDGGIVDIHDFFCVLNEAEGQGIPFHIPFISEEDKKWIKTYAEHYPENCKYIVNKLFP